MFAILSSETMGYSFASLFIFALAKTLSNISSFNFFNASRTAQNKFVMKLNEDFVVTECKKATTSVTNVKTVKCTRKNCTTCQNLIPGETFKSVHTGTEYVSNNDRTFACTDKNLVYIIQCDKCNYQYIGETTQKLKCRFTQHRYDVSKNKKSTYLVQHFNGVDHNVEHMKIKVIDALPLNVDNKRTKVVLRTLESNWIRVLNTAYPFGLNDNVKGFGNVSNWNNCLTTQEGRLPFFGLKVPKAKKKKRIKRHRSKRYDDNFIDKVAELHASDEHRKLYTYLRSSSKRTLKTALKLVECERVPNNIRMIIVGYYAGFFDSDKKLLREKKPDTIVLKYSSTQIEKLRLEKVLNKPLLQKLLGNVTSKNVTNDKCEIVYKYKNSIGNQLYNYNNFLKRNNMTELVAIARKPCMCETEFKNYVNKDVSHVITADVDVLQQNDISSFMKRGTNYRIDKPGITTEELNELAVNIRNYAEKVAKRSSTEGTDVELYCSKIMDYVENKIFVNNQPEPDLHNFKTQEFFDKFICTPVDKAANNFALTCKTFYAQKLLAELEVDTYRPCDYTSDLVIERHKKFTDKLGIQADFAENACLPVLYGIPKLHKNPVKFRYIAGAAKASTKPCAELLHAVLKHVKQHFRNYCKTVEKRSGCKVYISVENSIDVVNHFQRNIKNIESINTYDFSTLYTKLPHDIICQNMFSLIELMFRNNGSKYISVPQNKFGKTFYTNDMKDNHKAHYLDEFAIKELIHFIIDESYIVVGNTVFKQIAGIPMGGNASPLIADLTLSFMEYRYLHKNQPWRVNSCVFRYIDDILTVNCDLEVHKNKIYPKQLELNKELCTNSRINYLDITFNAQTCATTVYNKTDVFEFHVNRAFDADSCVHSRLIKGVIIGQMLRFARITTNLDDFIKTTVAYITLLKNKDHSNEVIFRGITTFCSRYEHKLWKYKLFDKKEVIKKFLNKVINYV